VTARGERLLQQARQRRIRVLTETLAHLSASELHVLRQAAELMESAVHSSAGRT